MTRPRRRIDLTTSYLRASAWVVILVFLSLCLCAPPVLWRLAGWRPRRCVPVRSPWSCRAAVVFSPGIAGWVLASPACESRRRLCGMLAAGLRGSPRGGAFPPCVRFSPCPWARTAAVLVRELGMPCPAGLDLPAWPAQRRKQPGGVGGWSGLSWRRWCGWPGVGVVGRGLAARAEPARSSVSWEGACLCSFARAAGTQRGRGCPFGIAGRQPSALRRGGVHPVPGVSRSLRDFSWHPRPSAC